MTYKMNVEVPDRLSDLLLMAIDDAEALDPEKYRLWPNDWYTQSMVTERCMVCLAGAVIARRGEIEDLAWAVNPKDFDRDWMLALHTLDGFRAGFYLLHASKFYGGQGYLSDLQKHVLIGLQDDVKSLAWDGGMASPTPVYGQMTRTEHFGEWAKWARQTLVPMLVECGL